MAKITKDVVIKTDRGDVVARMNLKDAVLDEHCEWYDGLGNLVAYGFFNNGAPLTGTFLNWANFFSDFPQEDPFEGELYCQDWVTIFEASFLSESPKYELVTESYSNGRKLRLLSTEDV